MISVKKVQDILDRSKQIYSKGEVEAFLDKMAEKMNAELKDANPIMLCVTIGGIVPLGNLLPRLDFHLEVDYIHLTRYQGKTHGGKLVWKAEPSVSLENRNVVIVDDILDEGITLKTIIDYCYEKGAKKVYSAIMLEKDKERLIEGVEHADFAGVVMEDEFVFGYGLDYDEYLRNVPAIHVVAPEDM
ncbi:MAG: hypoxanthine-guanine phosphoribosyltransferase [Gammaproteobacteria bacterium]|nr:hypoxanthine-guanine phosphoribosyltransferase [Gammaproteobacteria bacterium]